jgi:2-keto-4-pentenoate hydratase/2-oxohepta-3-ene-1,7-dioic acid hydratase in catechol pathway
MSPGPDGPEARVLASGDAGSSWLDIRRGLRELIIADGGDAIAAGRIAEATVPGSMSRALAGGSRFRAAVDEVLQARPPAAIVAAPRLTNALDPVTYRDFMVFQEHFSFGYRWQGKPVPEVMYELPVSYAGDPASFIGPDDVIPWPAYTQRLDYELELGIVIGKAGTDLTPDRALEHVLGLTILNDVSARDIQAREMTGGLGPSKGKHFACVTGPVITTLDELPSTGLTMTAVVNGTELCRTSSAEMVWSIAEIVAWASQGELLRPGALLGSGTCNGGSTIEIDHVLQPGDQIELTIEGLGTLRNILGQPRSGGWTPEPRQRDDTGSAKRMRFLR